MSLHGVLQKTALLCEVCVHMEMEACEYTKVFYSLCLESMQKEPLRSP